MKRIKAYIVQIVFICIAFQVFLHLPSNKMPTYIPIVDAATTSKLNMSKAIVYVNERLELKLSGTEESIQWQSSDEKIATVSKTGVVTGKKTGSVTISAKVGKTTYSCKVTVKEIKLSESNVILAVGDKKSITLEGATANITWKSSDKNILSIQKNGEILANATGKATITATYKNKNYTSKVTVVARKLDATTTSITSYYENQIMITVKDYKSSDKLIYTIEKEEIVSLKWGKAVDNSIPLIIIPKKPGKTKVFITTASSKQKLEINIKVIDNSSLEDKNTLTAKQIYANSKESMVQINTNISLGSGFFIDSGILVTNYHVIEGASSIEVIDYANKSYKVDTIVGYNKDLDIAILQVPTTKNQYLKINSHGATVGEEVYAIGSPLGLTDTFSNGIISNGRRVVDNVVYIQTNASISAGNSGGPLLNSYGEVIGIITATYTSGQNLNLALEINQLYQVPRIPITVSEFYKKTNNSQAATETDMIYEDEFKSTRAFTAQTIYLDYYVFGTMLKGGQFDIYKINIEKDGYYYVSLLDEYFDSEMTQLDISFFDGEFNQIRANDIGYYNNQRYNLTYLTTGTNYIVVSPILSFNKTDDLYYTFYIEENK